MLDKSRSVEISRDSRPGDIAKFLNLAFDNGDLEGICRAIGKTTKLHDIKHIANEAGIARTSVYRAFSGPRYPNFQTVLDVLDAMGFQLKVKVRSRSAKRTRLLKGRQRNYRPLHSWLKEREKSPDCLSDRPDDDWKLEAGGAELTSRAERPTCVEAPPTTGILVRPLKV
jgi:probable addiction module antidote protein